MTIGGFTFDFPTWAIKSRVDGSVGFAVCEVEGRECLTLLTDQDLIRAYLEQNPLPGEVTAVQFNTPAELSHWLHVAKTANFATHVAFDPVPKGYIWSIAEAIEIMRFDE